MEREAIKHETQNAHDGYNTDGVEARDPADAGKPLSETEGTQMAQMARWEPRRDIYCGSVDRVSV